MTDYDDEGRDDRTARAIERLVERSLIEPVLAVCQRRGVTLEELCGRGRSRAVVQARHEAWLALREDPERCFSLPEIGRLFGVDHTTVLAGLRKARERVESGRAVA